MFEQHKPVTIYITKNILLMVLCDTLWHSGLANQIVSLLNLEPAAEKEENAMQEGF